MLLGLSGGVQLCRRQGRVPEVLREDAGEATGRSAERVRRLRRVDDLEAEGRTGEPSVDVCSDMSVVASVRFRVHVETATHVPGHRCEQESD